MEINVNNGVSGNNNNEEHRSMDIQQNSVFNVQQDGSWEKFLPKPYHPTLDKNGWRRWPWVRMPWCIAGYRRKSRIICDYWTYKEMLRRMPPEHPIHSITDLEWVEM